MRDVKALIKAGKNRFPRVSGDEPVSIALVTLWI